MRLILATVVLLVLLAAAYYYYRRRDAYHPAPKFRNHPAFVNAPKRGAKAAAAAPCACAYNPQSA